MAAVNHPFGQEMFQNLQYLFKLVNSCGKINKALV